MIIIISYAWFFPWFVFYDIHIRIHIYWPAVYIKYIIMWCSLICWIYGWIKWLDCCCSAANWTCLTLCDPMDCSTPGFPVLPSPSPRVCSNSCPLSRWCHPTISSSVPFSSRLQSIPASGSFQMSQLFASGGSRILGPKWYVVNNSIWPMQACLSRLPSWVSPGLWHSLGQLVISLLLPSDSEGDQSPAHSVVRAWSDS